MKNQFKQIETERKIFPPQKSKRLSSSDMQPIIEQEKLFFEFTKAIMNDKDLKAVNFVSMS